MFEIGLKADGWSPKPRHIHAKKWTESTAADPQKAETSKIIDEKPTEKRQDELQKKSQYNKKVLRREKLYVSKNDGW